MARASATRFRLIFPWRRSAATTVALALTLLCSDRAFAVPPSVEATLACAPAGGVMVCVVQLEATLGAHVTWAEATIVSAPPFARPVRLRSTYEGSKTDPRLLLPLVLSGTGNGELAVLTRAVVCADDGTSCPKASKLLHATLHAPR